MKTSSGPNANGVAFSHSSHAAFNAQLNERGNAPANDAPTNDALAKPWISHDKVPQVHQQFEANTDPLIRAQRLAMEKTEAERRREQAERGDSSSGGGGPKASRQYQPAARMVAADAPKPALKPSRQMRKGADAQSFNERWMVEKRNAALARSNLATSLPERSQGSEQTHQHSQDRFQGPSM